MKTSKRSMRVGSVGQRGAKDARAARGGRRGSVLILVIAVLVLLALIGTAFITTSRNDRTTSVKVESAAQLDILAQGALNNITGQLQRNASVLRQIDLSLTPYQSYASFNPAPTSPGLFGIPALASRAPTAASANGAAPAWPTISAPLDAQPYLPGTRYPLPYAYPIPNYTDTASSYYTFPSSAARGPTYLDRNSPSDPVLLPGGQALATPNAGSFRSPIVNDTGSASFGGFTNFISTSGGQWGSYDSARRNLQVGQVSVNGVTYPALYSPLEGTNGVVVIAGDATGEGVADCGLNYVGPIAGTEFAGLTFYVGVRVVDNNSAINLNTAWSQSVDYNANTLTQIRNNRLFPTSIGLRESLPEDVSAGSDTIGPTGTPISTLDAQNSFSGVFLAHRAGNYVSGASGSALPYRTTGTVNFALNDYAQPDGATSYQPVPLFPPRTLAATTADVRADFQFATLQELEWFQLGRRVDFPGLAVPASGSVANVYSSFSLSDQVALAYASGTVLSPKGSVVEQYLPNSLARTSSSSATNLPVMSLNPYTTVGVRTSSGYAKGDTSWYGVNYNYEPLQGAGQALTCNVTNLRPFVVTRNGVSQAVGFRPLPGYNDVNDNPNNASFPQYANLVVADSLAASGSAPHLTRTNPTPTGLTALPLIAYDRMNPYVRVWNSYTTYEPGDVVRWYDTSTSTPANSKMWGNYTMTALVPTSAINTGWTTPGTSASMLARGSGTSEPNGVWQPYAAPIVPQKVDVNTAPFGDLWRAFYLTMASDNVAFDANQVYDGASHRGALAENSVTPFGPHLKSNGTANTELYRGMTFTAGTNGQAKATPSTVSTPGVFNPTVHPQKMFRSNIKDLSNGSFTGGTAGVADYAGVTDISADQMVLVRAASAAVNAEYLRACAGQQVLTSSGASSSGVGQPPALRDDIVRRNVAIRASVGGVANQQVMAEVYSAGKFPYITEVYYDSDPGIRKSSDSAATPPDTQGFIAIELYNPYPFQISLANFKIQRIARQASVTNTGATALEDVYTFGANSTAVVPAGGAIVLTNLNVAADVTPGGGTYNASIGPHTDATVIPLNGPGNLALPAKAKMFYVQGLETTLGHEVVLARPMKATFSVAAGLSLLTCDAPTALSATQVPPTDGVAAVNNAVVGHEVTEYYVPFDGIDLDGLEPYVIGDYQKPITPALPIKVNVRAYHYAREQYNWHFVYPGRYDGRQAIRQEGLNSETYTVQIPASGNATASNPFTSSTPTLTLGAAPTAGSALAVTSPQRVASYWPSLPLQVANWGFGGPNAVLTGDQTGVNRFPYGGFARLGDILQVTFISPIKYRLPQAQTAGAIAYSTSPGPIANAPKYIDVVTLTSDAAFAEDTNTWDDGEENVGRFAPIITPYPIVLGAGAYPPAPTSATQPPQGFTGTVIDEFAISGDGTTITGVPPTNAIQSTKGFYDQTQVMYGWANRLFDNVTVTSLSRSLRTPAAHANLLPTGATANQNSTYTAANYPGAAPGGDTYAKARPQAMSAKASNFPIGSADAQSDTGTEGQVNVNTAPLPVLAAIPWVRDPNSTTGTTATERAMNLRIAQAIIAYREPTLATGVGTTESQQGYQSLPFRPFRSLFELNKVVMATIAPSTGVVTYNGATSLRTGGLVANGSAGGWASTPYNGSASEKPPASLATQVDPSTNAYRQATGQGSATFSPTVGALFLRLGNGYFQPGIGSTFNPPSAQAQNVLDVPGTVNGYSVGEVYAADTIGNRTPVGDFQSQYFVMTGVSNLITVRSDTFTAYVVVEGWANAGTSSATRVIQRRYAYILDRTGAIVGMPNDVTGVGGGASVVVKPTVAGFGTPGPIRTTQVPAVGSN